MPDDWTVFDLSLPQQQQQPQQPKSHDDSYLEAITNAYVKSGVLSSKSDPQNSKWHAISIINYFV